jgi:hypothetical protein
VERVADADADPILWWSMGGTRMAPQQGWKDRKRIAKVPLHHESHSEQASMMEQRQRFEKTEE